jgi:hypothetical protein
MHPQQKAHRSIASSAAFFYGDRFSLSHDGGTAAQGHSERACQRRSILGSATARALVLITEIP